MAQPVLTLVDFALTPYLFMYFHFDIYLKWAKVSKYSTYLFTDTHTEKREFNDNVKYL